MRIKTVVIVVFLLLLCLGLSNCSTYFAAAPDNKGNVYLTRMKSFLFFSTSEVLQCAVVGKSLLESEELLCEKLSIEIENTNIETKNYKGK